MELQQHMIRRAWPAAVLLALGMTACGDGSADGPTRSRRSVDDAGLSVTRSEARLGPTSRRSTRKESSLIPPGHSGTIKLQHPDPTGKAISHVQPAASQVDSGERHRSQFRVERQWH